MKALLLTIVLSLASFACSGEPQTIGLTEPLRVGYGSTRNTQFRSGPLPGSRPLTSKEQLSNVAPQLPTATVNVPGAIVRELDTGFVIAGATSTEAVAIGIRFLDLGTGYWIVPVTGQDPTHPGTFTWSATADFGADIPPGLHQLGVVAIDGAGHGGTQVETDLCVASDIPDNLSACSPSLQPPTTVVSLVWDTPVDLDLRVITPQGKIVDPKHPSTAVAVDGHIDPTAKGTGIFDTDALRGCVNTGHRRENLVWQDAPEPGTYLVYASLYNACGQSAVHFTLSLNQREPSEDGGTLHLAETFETTGELLAADADAGVQLGLFVTSFTVQ